MKNLKSFILGVLFTLLCLFSIYGVVAFAQTMDRYPQPLLQSWGGKGEETGFYADSIDFDDAKCYYLTNQEAAFSFESLAQFVGLGCIPQ